MRSATVMSMGVLAFFGSAVLPQEMKAQSQANDAQPRGYRVINLGTLSGPSASGNTINNIGWAMGSADVSGNTTEHATVWIYGLRFDLGTLGGPNSDVQWPVKNDYGLVAGFSETAALNPLGESWSCAAFTPTGVPTHHNCVGFIWQLGVMTALPTLGGYNGFAAGANNEGQIVGWAENTVHDSTCVSPQVLQFEPVLYGPATGQIQQLPNYPGDPDGAATAINDHGQIVGISGTCDTSVGAFSAKHALLWQNGTVTNLGSLGGGGWNTPMAINSEGDIVGFSDLGGDVSGGALNANFHAFLWTNEHGMIDIGVLPGDSLSEALDINDRGQVVGVSFPSTHAFLYENGKMTDLNRLIAHDSPLVLLAANGINDRGEITGQACLIADGGCPAAGNETPAFLAIPTLNQDWGREGGALTGADVTVPESVREQVMRRVLFGHLGSEGPR